MQEALHKFVNVPFLGTTIPATADEKHYVVLKPVVEGIGLDWESTRQLLERSHLKSVTCMVKATADDGKVYKMLCLPLKKLNGLLFLINPSNYNHKPALKERLVQYQDECFKVLYDYFKKGYVLDEKHEKALNAIIQAQKQQLDDKQGQIDRLTGLYLEQAMARSAERQERKRKDIFVPDEREYGAKSKTTGKTKTKYRRGYYVSEGGKTIPLNTAVQIDLIDLLEALTALNQVKRLNG